jgi:excisionase family DNA binding protein
MAEKLLTPEEVAERLQVTLRTLQRWRTSGTGPAYIKSGRLIRYPEGDLKAWLAAHRRQPEQ